MAGMAVLSLAEIQAIHPSKKQGDEHWVKFWLLAKANRHTYPEVVEFMGWDIVKKEEPAPPPPPPPPPKPTLEEIHKKHPTQKQGDENWTMFWLVAKANKYTFPEVHKFLGWDKPTPDNRPEVKKNDGDYVPVLSKYEVNIHIKKPNIIGEPNFDSKRNLIIVDVYNWAWHIASKELIQYLPDPTDITSFKDFYVNSINVNDYQTVILYCLDQRIVKSMNPKNTVLCVAGGDFIENKWVIDNSCPRFNFLGPVNSKISQFLKNLYPDKDITILTHGVDLERFKPNRSMHRNKFVVGWAGRKSRELKRFGFAHQIVSQLMMRLNDIDFSVASQENDNHVKHKNMPNFFNSIDCLLVTSRVEGHPMVIYEAMACGTPVITTNVGDVDEYIDNWNNGVILPVNATQSEIESAIIRLKDNPKLAAEMGKNARKTVEEKLSWEVVSQAYIELINKIKGQKF